MERKEDPERLMRMKLRRMVWERLWGSSPLSLAAADGVGKSDSHEKGEGGLDEIVQAEPGPLDVSLV